MPLLYTYPMTKNFLSTSYNQNSNPTTEEVSPYYYRDFLRRKSIKE